MHPLIRLVVYLEFTLAMALGSPQVLALGGLLLLGVWLACRRGPGPGVWPMYRRMRWLLLAITVFYLGFTPGEPLWQGAWAPSLEGVSQAAHRLAILLLLVLALLTLMHLTPRPALIGALYRLFAPMTRLGFPAERFALRLHLTLAYLEGEQPAVSGNWLAKLNARLDQALAVPVVIEPVMLEVGAPVPLWQWLWPLALGIMLGFVW